MREVERITSFDSCIRLKDLEEIRNTFYILVDFNFIITFGVINPICWIIDLYTYIDGLEVGLWFPLNHLFVKVMEDLAFSCGA